MAIQMSKAQYEKNKREHAKRMAADAERRRQHDAAKKKPAPKPAPPKAPPQAAPQQPPMTFTDIQKGLFKPNVADQDAKQKLAIGIQNVPANTPLEQKLKERLGNEFENTFKEKPAEVAQAVQQAQAASSPKATLQAQSQAPGYSSPLNKKGKPYFKSNPKDSANYMDAINWRNVELHKRPDGKMNYYDPIIRTWNTVTPDIANRIKADKGQAIKAEAITPAEEAVPGFAYTGAGHQKAAEAAAAKEEAQKAQQAAGAAGATGTAGVPGQPGGQAGGAPGSVPNAPGGEGWWNQYGRLFFDPFNISGIHSGPSGSFPGGEGLAAAAMGKAGVGDTGGFLQSLKEFLVGQGGKAQFFPKFLPGQTAAMEQLLRQGLAGAPSLGQEGRLPNLGPAPQLPAFNPSFEPIAQQARGQFYGKTLPGLAERFTALGSSGRSGGFQNAMKEQSGEFERGLAALGAQYGLQARGQQAAERNVLGQERLAEQSNLAQQALRNQFQRSQNLQSLLQAGLQPQFQTLYTPGQPGLLQNAATSFAQAAPWLAFGAL